MISFTPKVGSLCISCGRLPAEDCKVLIITLSGKDNFLTGGKEVCGERSVFFGTGFLFLTGLVQAP